MPLEERGERIATVISLVELGYPQPTWDDARRLVEGLNRDAALIVLAQFNLFLSIASIQSQLHDDLNRRRYAQERIIANIISAERLEEIQRTLGAADLIDRILVHRSFAMAALRLVAASAQKVGGNKLETREDFNVLGELALIINSVTEPDEHDLTACEIAARIAPSREIENHPNVGLTLVRMQRILAVHLPNRVSKGGDVADTARRAEQVFTFQTDGFNFESFRDMTFATFLFYSGLSLEAVMRDQAITYLNTGHPDNVIGRDTLEKFLGLQAVDFEEVGPLLAEDASDERLLSDFTVFRQKPFWRFGEGRYLCVDPGFLMDKLAEGTYWWVMAGLGPEGHAESRERRGQFSALWGYLFEDYTEELLAYAHSTTKNFLFHRPHYVKPNEEAFDGLLIAGNDMVAIQSKSAFLPIGARYSGRCEPFIEGLNRQFGSDTRAAAEQLFRNLHLVFALDSEQREIKDTPLTDIRKVYPLALVEEPMLGFWLAAKLLVEPFVKRVESTLWRLDLEIRPLVFMTVDELEGLVEYIKAGDFGLNELLREKLGTDRDHLMSVSQFLHRVFLPSRGLQPRRNEFMAVELSLMKADFLSRVQSGAYS